MFANERQKQIAQMVASQGAVTTAHLLGCFDVSGETIRKDLLYLERKGVLLRVHGGAVLPTRFKAAGMLVERNTENIRQKQELAATAVQFIEEGDLIAIGAGSTAVALAQAIREKRRNLTVLTYSLDVLNTLRDCSGFSVLLCGGTYLPEENAAVGAFAQAMIEQIHIRKTFLCPMAISLHFGISDYREDIVQLQRRLIANSDEVYILADSSKFEKDSLLKTVDVKAAYTYITDPSLPPEIRSLYEQNNLRVVL